MAKFSLFIPILQQIEGGYQNLKKDKGNYNSLGQLVGTNFGISARFYEGIINRPPTVADMKAITKAQAEGIYKIYFWDDVQGDTLINQSVANLITDHAINGGETPIGRIVQGILAVNFGKKVIIDGDIGPTTAALINSVDQKILFDKIKAARARLYNEIGGDFVESWLSRLTKFSFTESEKKKPSELA